jgi:ABC-type sugar transport system substrate-binding protein
MQLTPRSRARLGIAALLALASIALAACGGGGSSTDSTAASNAAETTAQVAAYHGPDANFPTAYPRPQLKPGTQFTVGYLNPNGAIETLAAIEEGIRAQVGAYGGTVISKDAGLSVDKQATQFSQLLAQGVNAIITYPLDSRSLVPGLAAAEKKGVPVIGMDVTPDPSSPDPPGYTTQVVFSRDRSAFLAVEAIKEINPHATVGLIRIGFPVPGLQYYIDQVEYWAKKSGLTVVGSADNTNDTPEGAATATTTLLRDNPDAIVTYNDQTALASAQAVRAAGAETAVIGINGEEAALEAVRDGRLAVTIQVDAPGAGAEAAVAAYDAVTKQHLPLPKRIVDKGTLVTESNVDSLTSWEETIAEIGK